MGVGVLENALDAVVAAARDRALSDHAGLRALSRTLAERACDVARAACLSEALTVAHNRGLTRPVDVVEFSGRLHVVLQRHSSEDGINEGLYLACDYWVWQETHRPHRGADIGEWSRTAEAVGCPICRQHLAAARVAADDALHAELTAAATATSYNVLLDALTGHAAPETLDALAKRAEDIWLDRVHAQLVRQARPCRRQRPGA